MGVPLTLLAALLFRFSDPAADAQGSGYVYPIQPSIDQAALDLRDFEVYDSDGALEFRVGLGAIQNPWQLPSGYSAGVTDIFVKTPQGGGRTLSDLQTRVAGSGGWEYHVRITGAGAKLWHVQQAMPDPEMRIRGSTIEVKTSIPAGQYAYWVTSSLYSPLSATGLMPHSDKPSTTALQVGVPSMPVPVDVLAEAGDNSVYQTGLLAPVGETSDLRAWLLLAVGLLGLLVAVIASVKLWRRR